jgi:hypothetical protein
VAVRQERVLGGSAVVLVVLRRWFHTFNPVGDRLKFAAD